MRQPGLIGRLRRSRVKPLHADTDAEERYAARDDTANGVSETGLIEALSRSEVAYAGQDEAVSRFDKRQISIRDFDLGAEVTEGLEHRGEIARLVVDDRDTHQSSPFVLGSVSPNCLSREQATRSARAKALKIASIL